MDEDDKAKMVLHLIGPVSTYDHVLTGSLIFAEGTAPKTDRADDVIGNSTHHTWRSI